MCLEFAHKLVITEDYVAEGSYYSCCVRKSGESKEKQTFLCLLSDKSSGLLTSTHVHTGCLWFVWASERCETLLNSRHFVNFGAVVLQVGLSELHPRSLSASQDIFRLNVPSPVKICLCCACEDLHMCVHSGMWFCFLPAICGFSMRYFPRVLFLLLWKT